MPSALQVGALQAAPRAMFEGKGIRTKARAMGATLRWRRRKGRGNLTRRETKTDRLLQTATRKLSPGAQRPASRLHLGKKCRSAPWLSAVSSCRRSKNNASVPSCKDGSMQGRIGACRFDPPPLAARESRTGVDRRIRTLGSNSTACDRRQRQPVAGRVYLGASRRPWQVFSRLCSKCDRRR